MSLGTHATCLAIRCSGAQSHGAPLTVAAPAAAAVQPQQQKQNSGPMTLTMPAGWPIYQFLGFFRPFLVKNWSKTGLKSLIGRLRFICTNFHQNSSIPEPFRTIFHNFLKILGPKFRTFFEKMDLRWLLRPNHPYKNDRILILSL